MDEQFDLRECVRRYAVFVAITLSLYTLAVAAGYTLEIKAANVTSQNSLMPGIPTLRQMETGRMPSFKLPTFTPSVPRAATHFLKRGVQWGLLGLACLIGYGFHWVEKRRADHNFALLLRDD